MVAQLCDGGSVGDAHTDFFVTRKHSDKHLVWSFGAWQSQIGIILSPVTAQFTHVVVASIDHQVISEMRWSASIAGLGSVLDSGLSNG